MTYPIIQIIVILVMAFVHLVVIGSKLSESELPDEKTISMLTILIGLMVACFLTLVTYPMWMPIIASMQ